LKMGNSGYRRGYLRLTAYGWILTGDNIIQMPIEIWSMNI